MATEERHITRMLKTEALFRANGDQGQSAILTDQNEEWVYYNSGKSKLYYQASQKYWDGDAWTYCDVDFGELTLHDDLLVDEYIKRSAGSDDSIRFENDIITIEAGGETVAEFEDDAITFSKVFTGISASAIGTLTFADGSITDSGGAISFGNENLSTTGSITGNSFITASNIGIAGDLDIIQLTGANAMQINSFLGIGKAASTTYKLDIDYRPIDSTSHYGARVYFQPSVTQNGAYGGRAMSFELYTNIANGVLDNADNVAIAGVASHASAGNLKNLYGFYINYGTSAGSGNITTWQAGLRINPYQGGTGTVAYGADIMINTPSGSTKTITHDYCIYSLHDAISRFVGAIQIDSDVNGLVLGAGQDSKVYDDGSYMIFDCDNQSVTSREFKFINGNIWLDNARQAGAPTPDGYLLVKDSTGTQYKIPCEAA